MAVRVPGQRSVRWRLSGLGEGAWTGGLNLRDEYTEVAPNELMDGTNLTLDERGKAIKRNDCPTTADFPAPPGHVDHFFYSQATGWAIIQVGTTLYRCTIGAGAWTSFRVCSSALRCAFCDFNSTVVYVHAADGVRRIDGAGTDTAVAGSPVGFEIAVWQNKVWVAGGGSRLRWSGLGDATVWNANDFVDLRDKDDQALIALYGGTSGLLVFKEQSTYRVSDSTTGAYQTIDPSVGCVSTRGVVAQDGLVYTWGLDGLYQGNGFGRFVNIGDKLRPRFTGPTSNVNSTTKPLITATTQGGRVYFAFPRTSSTIADAILELNPRVGWLMESYFGGAEVGAFATYLNGGISFVAFASGSASIKRLFTGTTRTGFSCSLLTGYQQPFGGYLCNIMRMGVSLNLPGMTPPAVKLNYLNMGPLPQTFGPLTLLIPAAGALQANAMPRIRGRAFQLSIDDAAAPLNSLSVFDAQMDALLVGLN